MRARSFDRGSLRAGARAFPARRGDPESARIRSKAVAWRCAVKIVVSYLLTLATFAVIDTVWLGAMAGRLYRPLIGTMLAEEFRLVPAVFF